MKIHFITLPAFALALGSLAFGLPPGDSRIFAQDSAQPAVQPANKAAWSIGIYTGPSPFQLAPPAGLQNPVLTADMVTDMEVNIVAHPFMVVTDSMYYLFFTAKNDINEEVSGIGMAQSRDGLHWQ